MQIKQISVFIENKSGRLADVINILAGKGINISATSIADTTDFGILRLIVDRPLEAEEALKSAGFAVKRTTVVAVLVDDVPGGLAKALNALTQKNITIEYLYTFKGKEFDKPAVILRVEDTDEAINILKDANIEVLNADKVYAV